MKAAVRFFKSLLSGGQGALRLPPRGCSPAGGSASISIAVFVGVVTVGIISVGFIFNAIM